MPPGPPHSAREAGNGAPPHFIPLKPTQVSMAEVRKPGEDEWLLSATSSYLLLCRLERPWSLGHVSRGLSPLARC